MRYYVDEHDEGCKIRERPTLLHFTVAAPFSTLPLFLTQLPTLLTMSLGNYGFKLAALNLNLSFQEE